MMNESLTDLERLAHNAESSGDTALALKCIEARMKYMLEMLKREAINIQSLSEETIDSLISCLGKAITETQNIGQRKKIKKTALNIPKV